MEISIGEHIIHRPILLANLVKVEVEQVILNKSASLKVIFGSESESGKRYIWDEIYKLSQEEYEQWGEDDNYLLNLVIKKYNLKLK